MTRCHPVYHPWGPALVMKSLREAAWEHCIKGTFYVQSEHGGPKAPGPGIFHIMDEACGQVCGGAAGEGPKLLWMENLMINGHPGHSLSHQAL